MRSCSRARSRWCWTTADVTLRAGDVVVQCGTNHAWSNRSDAPCVVAFVLIDGEFEPELAK